MSPRFDAVGLVVDDLHASLAFYRLLGIDVEEPAEGQPHVEATLPGGMRLLWDTPDTIRSFQPGWAPPAGGRPRTALAFACDSPAEVDATYAAVTDAGHEGVVPPWDAFWGQRYAVLHDPDGNAVDLFAAL
jgi:catechol 2,3-dioxygenase-like lactoylglutathione lyase family enzyme